MWRCILATLLVMMFSLASSIVTIPLALNLAGFFPSILALLASWLYLLLTSHYYLQATLSLPSGANVYSISKKYNPIMGTWLNTIIFFAVNYSVIVLYDYLGIPILRAIYNEIGAPWPLALSYVTFGLLFGFSLCFGLKWIAILNGFLSLTFLFFLALIWQEAIEMPLTEPTQSVGLDFLVLVFPSLLNSLYMQTLIPTLVPFLNRDKKQLKGVIIIGLTLSFLIFAIWLRLVIRKAGTSFEHLDDLYPIALNYQALREVPYIGRWLPHITVATLASSVVITIALLVDFFSDWLNIPIEERKGKKRAALTLCLFAPALLAPGITSRFFLNLFDLISDIGGIYLCGLLPIWWMWSSRYKNHEQASIAPKGRGLLLVLTLLSFFIFYLVGLEFIYSKFQ